MMYIYTHYKYVKLIMTKNENNTEHLIKNKKKTSRNTVMIVLIVITIRSVTMK